jgi:hypothetical protein
MVWDFLKRVFASPQPVTALAEVRTGKAILRGIVRADGDLVRSPVKGMSCVAFYYRAWTKAAARGKTVDRVIRDAEVYAPRFAIELEGGTVAVVASKPGKFDASDHREVLAGAMPGTQVIEQIIRPGDRVAIHGPVHHEGDGFRIRPNQFDMLGSADEGSAGRPGGKRKRRR